MQKLLLLGIFVAGIGIAVSLSKQCSPLPPPEGVVMQCLNKTNATMDCSVLGVDKGVQVQYRCKNGSDSDWANATMKCICKGKWKGLEDFNSYITTNCGATAITLPTNENSTNSDDPTSQPMNMNNTSLEGTTEVPIEKGTVSDLTSGSTNSSDMSSNNATSVMPLDSNSTISAPLNTTTSADASTSGNSSNSVSSTASPDASNSTNSSDSSTPSSLSSSSSPSDNSTSSESPVPISPADVSASTPDGSNSTNSATTTPTSSGDMSSTSTTESSVNTPSNLSGKSDTTNQTANSTSNSADPTTTVGPMVANETSGQVPATNDTTTVIDDAEKRQGKDLKLDALNNSTSASDTPTTTPSSPAPSDLTSEVTPSSGASLAVVNASSDTNGTSSPTPSSETTTPSSPIESSSSENPSTAETAATGNGSVKEFQLASLDYHNKYRKNHDAQPMALNETLNGLAQSWAESLANQSKLESTPGKRPYSENIFRITGGKVSELHAVEAAMRAWTSSRSWFNYSDPKPTGFSQVIWNATTQLGVGLAANNESTVVVCTYFPRGNVVAVGAKDSKFYFRKNVFPEISNPVEVFPPSTNSTTTTNTNSTST